MAENLLAMERIMRDVLTCLPAPPSPAAGGSRPSPSIHRGGGGGGEDRISRLPDALLSNIVAPLPTKDAVRTAALSRLWSRVWASAQLVLDDTDVLLTLPSRHGRGGLDWLGTTDAVSRVIGAQRGPIRYVRLTCCHMETVARMGLLGYWLHRFAAGGAEELVLVNRPHPRALLLPAADVLRTASLRTLYLGFWAFPDTAGLPRGPGVFPRLQEIGLCHVFIHHTVVDHLLACSPVLQKLAIVATCYNDGHFRIRSRSLQCLVFWKSRADALEVAVAPRLQRLILWERTTDSGFRIRVRIGHPTVLKVLGYLQPGIHELEIGGTIIEWNKDDPIPSTMIPSVKILALKVPFGIRKEAKMLPNFLRCFPNVETLHVLSHEADEPTGKLNLKFWQEVGPIDCLDTHITKVVFDKFRGERYEFAFLKFILERAQSLLKLVVVLANGDQALVDEMLIKLKPLTTAKPASECPTLLAVARDGDSAWCFQRASDLSVSDPFDW